MRALLAVLLCAVLLSPVAQAAPVQVVLGQPVVLAVGEQAGTVDGAVRVRFDRVLEDSRCPAQVECFWTGRARIAVVVEPAGQAPVTVDFDTNPAPGSTVTTARAGAFDITLRALDPYPQTPEAIPLPDYRATLVVSR
jgi:hypothetical protein